MFCGLLLRGSSDNSPIVAQTSDVNVNALSGFGEGTANLTYILSDDTDDLVFCVPYLIAHHEKTRQYVKLTHCSLLVTNLRDGKSEEYRFQVRELKREEYLSEASLLPTFAELKQRYKHVLTAYSGAHSSEDTFLHLGKQSALSRLKIQVQFLVKFDSPLAVCPHALKPSLSLNVTPPIWQYMIHNVLPTRHLTYSLTMASLVPIKRIVVEPSIENEFNWEHVSNGESNLNVVKVCCELHSHLVLRNRLTCTFSVLFASGSLCACYSVGKSCGDVFQKLPKQQNESEHQITRPLTKHVDAIMMLSITLSTDQLPRNIQCQPLYPSEVLFIIDCSGSMSGSNIQSAADMLVTCVKSLPFGCYFNVIAFGSHFRQLFHASEMYTKYTVKRAVTFANQLQATLGGTDLLPPLQWIFKKNCCEKLSRQLFIITDGGVTNTQQVLNIVKKNQHHARCHTFGIGSEVCVELVTGIASVSGGRCVLLKEGERLQTKVMEVLKESLQPSVSHAMLTWNVPDKYLLVDASPKSLGTMYVGNSYCAFAFLQRNNGDDGEEHCVGSARIDGVVGDENCKIDVKSTHLRSIRSADIDMLSLVSQNAIWMKLVDLEYQVNTSFRKSSHLSGAIHEEPDSKRSCLGDTNSSSTSAIHKALLDCSLQNQIPSAVSYFTTTRRMLQVLRIHVPYEVTVNKTETSGSASHAHSKIRRYRRYKYHRRSHNRSSSNLASFSFTSFARSTLSNVTARIRSVVDLFVPESNTTTTNDVQMLEDEVEFQEKMGSQLRLDNSNTLVYPAFYYELHGPKLSNCKGQRSQWHEEIGEVFPHDKPSTTHTPTFSNDSEVTISDSESDSSVDPGWCDLGKPCDHSPIIHMQLFCGAWPITKPFSYAIGVPLDEIRKLTLNNACTEACMRSAAVSCSVKDEANANFWCTALAVTCLEQHFASLSTEWELVAYKGRNWLEKNQYLSKLALDEVYCVAKRLVLRRS